MKYGRLLPLFSLFLGLLLPIVSGHPLAAAEKPNIILVMTDDQGYGDLECHGHPYLKTPNLNKLYSQSTRFTDFHVSPTCAPTRAALMSGWLPFKCGITHTILERERMTLEATTIAQVLKTAGYTTGVFGKWHLGDSDPYQPDSRGFDEVFIHAAGGIGQNFPGTQGAVPGTSYFDPIIKHNGVFEKTTGYCTDVFFQQALAWMKQTKEKEGARQPFFAYIATNAPHGPFIVADKYKKLYEGKSPNGAAKKAPAKPAGKKGKKSKKSKGNRTPAFYGMIHNIDENMGLLMNKLDEWQLASNTLLIFMTDNGSSAGDWNAGMKGKKGSVDRGGSRVPLFMRLPGLTKAGVDLNHLSRHVDLFPTFAQLAGLELKSEWDLDGRSLLPALKNPEAAWADREMFFHRGRWNKAGAGSKWGAGNTDPDTAKYNGFAVRTQQWRLVGKNALYDMQKDPQQQNNIIKDHPEVAEKLLKSFDAWWTSVRPKMVNEDASLDTGKPFIEAFNKQKAEGEIPKWPVPEL